MCTLCPMAKPPPAKRIRIRHSGSFTDQFGATQYFQEQSISDLSPLHPSLIVSSAISIESPLTSLIESHSESLQLQAMQTVTEESIIYRVWVTVEHFPFKGCRDPVDSFTKLIEAPSLENWKRKLFDLVKRFIKGHFSARDDGKPANPVFLGYELAEFDDYINMEHIVLKWSNRREPLGRISADLLRTLTQTTREKNSAPIGVYDYGYNASKKDYAYLENKNRDGGSRQTDRAGAILLEKKNEIEEKLKAQHSTSFKANEMVWKMWAAYILKQKVADQESMINEPPPSEIRDFLTPIPSRYETLNDEINSEYHLSLSILNQIEEEEKASFSGMLDLLWKRFFSFFF